MVTLAPPPLYGIYKLIDPHFRTNKIGGVVGDAAHGSGYHLSPDDLRARGLGSSDYSLKCPADRRGPAKYAAAIDVTFGDLDELITLHKRLRAACTPNSNGDYDPRIECVREFGGTLDGRHVSGYNRVATGTGSRSRVGWVGSGFMDSSHLWHSHTSILRDRVLNVNDMHGLAEVMAGVKPGTFGWTDGSKPTTTPTPAAKPAAPTDLELLMALDAKTLNAIAAAVWNADVVPNLGLTADKTNLTLAAKNSVVEVFREANAARDEAKAARAEVKALNTKLDAILKALTPAATPTTPTVPAAPGKA